MDALQDKAHPTIMGAGVSDEDLLGKIKAAVDRASKPYEEWGLALRLEALSFDDLMDMVETIDPKLLTQGVSPESVNFRKFIYAVVTKGVKNPGTGRAFLTEEVLGDKDFAKVSKIAKEIIALSGLNISSAIAQKN